MIIDILSALGIMVCYLIGGQFNKATRRYGVPVLTLLYAQIKDKKATAKERLRYVALLLLIGILSMGYGTNSFLKNKICFGIEWLTRAVYALLISLVFFLAGANWFFCAPILIIAFQIRAGVLFKIGNFEVLIEDIARSLAIFACAFIMVHF